MIIQDGHSGNTAKINDNNQLLTSSVGESEGLFAAHTGDAYNINTGVISLSATTGVLYFKNNETKSFVLSAIAIGFGAGSASDIAQIQLIRNPTTGTLISANNNVDQNQNRNFDSNKTLDATALKGASGETITDGDDIAIFFQGFSGRLFASIDFVLPKGTSLGLEINPNLSSGSVNVYAALIGYLDES